MEQIREMVRVDQERMLMAFLDLDREERTARLMVEEYRTWLPDRSSATTIVPRYLDLQQQVTALNEKYVALVDAYDPPERLRPPRLQEAGRAYRTMAERLEEMASRVSAFLDAAGADLQKVGAAKSHVDARLEAVRQHLSRALEAVADLESGGHRSSAATAALVRVRAVAREAVAWSPQLGTPELDAVTERVRMAAALAVETAEAFPQLVAGVPLRARSLRTRLESAQSRSRTMVEDLGHLRRSFRGEDWLDIDQSEEHAERALRQASSMLEELDQAVAAGRLEDALGVVEVVRSALDALDELVDAPRRRRERLEAIKADPRHAVGQARFAVRDAQMMLQSGGQADRARFAPELDALSARVLRVQAELASGSASLWRAAQELDVIVASVRALVTRYRSVARG